MNILGPKAGIATVAHIYQVALDAKFISITDVMTRDLGYGDNATGLTAERRSYVQTLAEQAIINWAFARKSQAARLAPETNLQHLLNEYCALAEHL